MPAFDSDNKTIGELRAREEKVRLLRLNQEPEYIAALAQLTDANERLEELEAEIGGLHFDTAELVGGLQSRIDELNKGYNAMHTEASGFKARIDAAVEKLEYMRENLPAWFAKSSAFDAHEILTDTTGKDIDDCPVCGAPQCCPKCCRKVKAEAKRRKDRTMCPTVRQCIAPADEGCFATVLLDWPDVHVNVTILNEHRGGTHKTKKAAIEACEAFMRKIKES